MLTCFNKYNELMTQFMQNPRLLVNDYSYRNMQFSNRMQYTLHYILIYF